MIVYKTGSKYIRIVALILLVSIPNLFIISYGLRIARLGNEAISFTYDPEVLPDPATFKEANFSRMEEMALYYDDRFEKYHIPLNMSTDTIFSDENCTEVAWYAFSDNTGQWTGLAITAFVMKYLAGIRENNTVLKNDALRVIRRLLHGMSMQLAVPNGGLGPEYGAVLARGWADPAHRDLPGVEWYFGDGNGRHHNGTGKYHNWRWRGFTSNDEYSGFYAGLAITYKYVEDAEIRSLISLMVDQIADYMIDNNFLGMDWNGAPTGVRQRPLAYQGAIWPLLLLKLASMALPEKYARLYKHYLTEEFYAWYAREGGPQEVVANYYSYAFGYHITFAYLLLIRDDEPALYEHVLKLYENSLRAYTRTHRNPFYNMIHLILTESPGTDTYLEGDVIDQLMRYDCPYHFPDRALGHADISGDPSYKRVSNMDNLIEFFSTDKYGAYYAPFFMEYEPLTYVNKPLTVEYMGGNIFIWEKNPWRYYENSYINPRYEFAGFSFPLIYWMGRAFGFFS